jgi:hypothetical protein
MLRDFVDWLSDLARRLPEELLIYLIVRWIERLLS